ncbi:MAG TPA: tyrosine--tRNA ligase [Puia sp.]|nr:tyrosine--tRNA ligase [Puia sp.]
MPGTAELLAREMVSGYIGFDPTADSLHIGSLVPILLLVHLQKAGHKPIALLGGATGMVGDPSGKSEERNLLDEDTLNHNLRGVKAQLEKFLDFDPVLPNSAEMVNNYDWFKDMSFLSFIRDVGKYITVNYMSAKDSVRKRLDGENGMSFTEFTYQLVQGYDFYWLYANKNCKLQMGGSDQWGNITTGTELVRRKAGGEAFAFTCPLITKADGGKFGKTEKGNIWLDPVRTSPYQFYQFWLNATDTDAEKWIRIFTFLSKDEIDFLIEQHKGNEHLRLLQKKLAEQVTIFVHGLDKFLKARSASDFIFSPDSNGNILDEVDTETFLSIFEGVPVHHISLDKIKSTIPIIDFLVESKILSSKGEARKLVQNGGLSIKKWKVPNIEYNVTYQDLVQGKYIVIQKGKKNYFLVKAI